MKLSRRPLRRKDYWDKSRDEIINAILTDTLNKNAEIDIEDDYRKSTVMLGDYVTLDWPHIQDIHKIRSTIIEYANDPSRRRPLNLIMVAQAGSGKSYFVNQLAKKISSTRVGAVSFNMSNLSNIDDLVQPLDAVRNMKVIDLLPILFLDEFDSNPSNFSLLLPLLWDGELHVGHRDLKLGKVVIILAGSDLEIKKNYSYSQRNAKKLWQ
jgi:predicted AAA+ superfamily ATPase